MSKIEKVFWPGKDGPQMQIGDTIGFKPHEFKVAEIKEYYDQVGHWLLVFDDGDNLRFKYNARHVYAIEYLQTEPT